MRKSRSLVKSIILSLIILSTIYFISMIVYQFYSVELNKKEDKLYHYNNILLLANEINKEVNELDKLKNLYADTGSRTYLDRYKEIIKVYNGTSIRDKEYYHVQYGIAKPFKELMLSEIISYDPTFNDDASQLILLVDEILILHTELINNRNILNNIQIAEAKIDTYLEVLELEHKISEFTYKLSERNDVFIASIDRNLTILKYSWYLVNTVLFTFGLYISIRTYILLIKPIRDGSMLVEQISRGEKYERWNYKYNNELKDLVNSFNNYFNLSQNSLNLINEQYNKLKIYSDIGEVNYFELNTKEKLAKILYSKKFVEKYKLSSNEMIYTIEEFLTYVYFNDKEELKRRIATYDDYKELKLEFRMTFPNVEELCYMQVMGQRDKENPHTIIGVQVDITDIKQTEQLLKQQEEQYRLIVENSTDLIAKFDKDGKLLFSSQSYRDTFNDIEKIIKVAPWFSKVKQLPFSSSEIVAVQTPKGERWISWNNEAILDENGEVTAVIAVGHDITDIKNMNDRLKYDTEHDVLTGLLNRRGLFNAIDNLKNIETIAAFFIDINNFKNINDFYGHEIGDTIIKKVANELMDFEKYKCIISRLSGDEFLVLFPNFNNNSSLTFVKNRFKKNLQKNYHIQGNDIFISSSVGYAIYPYDTDDINKLISYADIAMYEAKVTHNYNCVRYTSDMFNVVNNKVEMANDLKKAIDNDEFVIVFQPIMNVRTNEIDSFESLVRWNSSKGEIQPATFLPIAEESGFIYKIDMLIIKKALKIYYDYQCLKPSNHKLAINVTPIMLLKKDFPQKLYKLTRAQNLNPSDIIVEISENTFVHNVEECSVQINRLREKGFLVALDDFGREYSSLSILEKVEFDIIKIDMMFTSNLDNDTNVEIIKMVNKIARIKNKKVIVEGIETEHQKERLIALGCQFQQGYYFARPKPFDIEEN